MSEIVSNVELRKADGKPIIFNFQFENGFPMRPLVNVKREVWINDDSLYGITVMIEEKDRELVDFNIKNVSYHDTDNVNVKNIWIHLQKCYLVVSNINNTLLEKMLKNKLLFTFVDSNGNQLN